MAICVIVTLKRPGPVAPSTPHVLSAPAKNATGAVIVVLLMLIVGVDKLAVPVRTAIGVHTRAFVGRLQIPVTSKISGLLLPLNR